MTKPVYDIMKCHDGTVRAVPLVNGVKIDPSLPKGSGLSEKKSDEKKIRPKISIQDRLQGKVEDFISAIEGQVDEFIDSDYKLKYDMYNHMLEIGCKAAHARKMRPFYVD